MLRKLPAALSARSHTLARTTATRALSSSKASASDRPSHTADTYKKDDFDPTPPEDSSIFRVDAGTESVQKPHEPPSGEWSRAGARTAEYEHSDNAYATEGSPSLRYGGKEAYGKGKGPDSSEGPEKRSSGGRR